MFQRIEAVSFLPVRSRWVSREHLLTRSRMPPLVTPRHLPSSSLSSKGQLRAMRARLRSEVRDTPERLTLRTHAAPTAWTEVALWGPLHTSLARMARSAVSEATRGDSLRLIWDQRTGCQTKVLSLEHVAASFERSRDPRMFARIRVRRPSLSDRRWHAVDTRPSVVIRELTWHVSDPRELSPS